MYSREEDSTLSFLNLAAFRHPYCRGQAGEASSGIAKLLTKPLSIEGS